MYLIAFPRENAPKVRLRKAEERSQHTKYTRELAGYTRELAGLYCSGDDAHLSLGVDVLVVGGSAVAGAGQPVSPYLAKRSLSILRYLRGGIFICSALLTANIHPTMCLLPLSNRAYSSCRLD